jgi:hypothetical protein
MPASYFDERRGSLERIPGAGCGDDLVGMTPEQRCLLICARFKKK